MGVHKRKSSNGINNNQLALQPICINAKNTMVNKLEILLLLSRNS